MINQLFTGNKKKNIKNPKNMQPILYLNINYHDNLLRLPLEFVLNEKRNYVNGIITTNPELKNNKYLLNIEDNYYDNINKYDDSILGIITDKIPIKQVHQPILIINKKYFKILHEISKSGNIYISIETINFTNRFLLLFSFMFEIPQVMFLGFVFIIMVKILPLIDRKVLTRNVLKRKIPLNLDLIESCSICLEKYNTNDVIGETNCNHKYHEECFKNWVKHSDLCPICKNNVFNKQVSLISEIYSIPLSYNYNT